MNFGRLIGGMIFAQSILYLNNFKAVFISNQGLDNNRYSYIIFELINKAFRGQRGRIV